MANLVLQTVDGHMIHISKDKITIQNKDVEIRVEQKLIEIDAAGGSSIKMDSSDIELKANGSITLDAMAGIKLKTMKLDIG
jgi:uncharacterized protein (DUF2345 family)